MPATELYQVSQTQKITVSRPRPLAGIGGDNGTPFFLFFPFMPPGMQWVFPQVYGFLYPLPATMAVGGFVVDPTQFPFGATAPPAGSTQKAQLTGYGPGAGPLAFSPGFPASSSAIVRWNVNSLPATGVQATASRAAAPGVTHICDSALLRIAQNTGTPAVANIRGSVIDGASGGATFLMTTLYSVQAVNGVIDGPPLGPGLNYRGTPGRALTVEFSGGATGTTQAASASGFDQ